MKIGRVTGVGLVMATTLVGRISNGKRRGAFNRAGALATPPPWTLPAWGVEEKEVTPVFKRLIIGIMKQKIKQRMCK